MGAASIKDILEECLSKSYGSESLYGPNLERNKRMFDDLMDERSKDMPPDQKNYFYKVALSTMMSKMYSQMEVKKSVKRVTKIIIMVSKTVLFKMIYFYRNKQSKIKGMPTENTIF